MYVLVHVHVVRLDQLLLSSIFFNVLSCNTASDRCCQVSSTVDKAVSCQFYYTVLTPDSSTRSTAVASACVSSVPARLFAIA